MSKQLIESIIDGNYISAEHHFHDRLNTIMEQKLFEEKRRLSAINELVRPDPNRPGQFVGQNTKKDWAKYRKQNPQLSLHGTPDSPKAKAPTEKREKTSTGSLTKHGISARRNRGYLQAGEAIPAKKFIDAVSSYIEKKKGLQEQESFVSGSIERLKKAQAAPSQTSYTTNVTGSFDNKKVGVDKSKPDLIKGMSAVGKKEAEKIAYRKKVATMGNKPKSSVSDDSVSSGMKRVIRQKFREKTGQSATGLAAKNIAKAFSPTSGASLGGRVRAIKRAGTSLGTIGKGTVGRAAKGAASGFVNALTSLEEEKG